MYYDYFGSEASIVTNLRIPAHDAYMRLKYANDVGEMGDLGPLMYFTQRESIEIGVLEIDL